ncbi:MAG: hypothetical protein A2Y62_17805 [Candidatus Fischerbacteria bacterium RBG_13_37_8]|uniref:Endolytic murein transglycosylase n=1 Tax=Candidatus Fischerbacteria bacterium RBG_13_37_8 TaxID=1817863 RepID=A0A1F5VPD9_9BACT|nr:MAG: hypothetical protein A2Y62_17805 [Candidatus Fischerbacteria bacterium RBG_13_37_8]
MSKKIILLLFFVALVIGFTWYSYETLNEPQYSLSVPVEVYIKPGTSFSGTIASLTEKGLLKDPFVFKLYFLATDKHRYIKAGYYLFDEPLSIIEFGDKLIKGESLYSKITIPEGSNLFDIEGILRKQGLLEGTDYFQLIVSEELLKEARTIEPEIESLEGYLFPETYYFAKGETALSLLTMMIREFKKRYIPLLKKKAEEMNSTVKALVIMASLIEKETGYVEEKPLVASVFYNRLGRGMKLQCDPTVYYSFFMMGRYPEILTKEDLEIDSPYNTYYYSGFPPTPICNPGSTSIQAALNPANSDYLYFVSKRDGTHYFSRNLNEHLNAKAKYQR